MRCERFEIGIREVLGLFPADGLRVHAPSSQEGTRVVLDVVRLETGHTEGLEPEVTDELLQLMLYATGGKMKAL